MRVDAFRPAADFERDMDLWISRFRSAEPIAANQRVLIPGDPEREMEQLRSLHGIPLHETVFEDLQALAKKFNIKF
jgi:LDH2 family malate/lactate/ureidoglycolate dehydrogenase